MNQVHVQEHKVVQYISRDFLCANVSRNIIGVYYTNIVPMKMNDLIFFRSYNVQHYSKLVYNPEAYKLKANRTRV